MYTNVPPGNQTWQIMAMENGPFVGDLPFNTSIHRGFSIAMFDCQRICNMNHDLAGASTPSAAFPSAFSDASDTAALRQARVYDSQLEGVPFLQHWFVVPCCSFLYLIVIDLFFV